jgi:hypothetical protein
MNDVRSELRKKFPVLSDKAATYGGCRSAIKIFCIECMGGNVNDARTCAESSCRLWMQAFKRDPSKLPPRKILTDEQRKVMADRFAAARAKK